MFSYNLGNALIKLAYGGDSLTGNLYELLERAEIPNNEKDLEEFRDEHLKYFPGTKSLKLHFGRYNSSDGVELVGQNDLSKVKALLLEAMKRHNDLEDDNYTPNDVIPFYHLQQVLDEKARKEYLENYNNDDDDY